MEVNQPLEEAILGKRHEFIQIDNTDDVIETWKGKEKRKIYPSNDKKAVGVREISLTTRTYIDKETGLESEASVITKRVAHNYPRGWQRVFLKDLFFLLSNGFARNKEIQVLNYIFENTDKLHRFYQSQRQVATITNISITKINATFKKLQEIDIIQKIPNTMTGFEINPKIIAAFGSDSRNVEFICRYEELKNDDVIDKEIMEKFNNRKKRKSLKRG